MTSLYCNPSSTSSKGPNQSSDVEVERISRSLTRLVKNILRESPNTVSKANGKGTLNSTEVGKNAELSTHQQQAFDYCMRILGR